MTESKKYLAGNLKRLREASGVNISDVVKYTPNLRRSYLRQMEEETRDNPSLAVLIQIARFYGVSISELVKEIGDEK